MKRRLLALLCLLALSNLAPQSSTTNQGFRSLAGAGCCLKVSNRDFVYFRNGNVYRLTPEQGVYVAIALVIEYIYGDFFSLVVGYRDRYGSDTSKWPTDQPSFREATSLSDWQQSEPGFFSGQVIKGGVLERISDTEYRLAVTGASMIEGANPKEYAAVDTQLYDDQLKLISTDRTINWRSFLQFRGLGYQIRESAKQVSSRSTPENLGSVTVTVLEPGEEPPPAQENWEFTASVLSGYEQFLDGTVEIVEDFPGPASAQLRFRGNPASVPAGQAFQRVP
ncbi:MAG: hypothetical protein JSU96_13985, partial [Acidobacteriota bacterium]